MSQPTFVRALLGDAETRGHLMLIYGGIIAFNLIAWIWAFVQFSDEPILLGTALLAYILGLRHAVDADHIAAIDNVVRKLMQDGKKPLTVGLFFSLGHSSIVIIASATIAGSSAALQTPLAPFREIGGIIGTLVSSVFLLGIGIANLVLLSSIWGAFRRSQRGDKAACNELDAMLANRGFLARIFRRLFSLARKSWHMYPVGFLFGLGFDTATEIGLLGISASHASEGMNLWSIMVFPALFTAGMALVDTTDSVAMVGAYGWAFVNPMRKLWYNLTMTAASVAIAIVIGGIEVVGLLSEKFGVSGGLWDVVGGLNEDLANLGYLVVGIFLLSWLVSVLVYRAKRPDEAAG